MSLPGSVPIIAAPDNFRSTRTPLSCGRPLRSTAPLRATGCHALLSHRSLADGRPPKNES
jgi:hypothetical protein